METETDDQTSTAECENDPSLSLTDDTEHEQMDIDPIPEDEKDPPDRAGEASGGNRNARQKENAEHLMTDDHEMLFKDDNAVQAKSLTTENPKLTPELTLLLFGDSDAVDSGSNLLLDPDKETDEPFSAILYDLCGRVIAIIDLLGQKNNDHSLSGKSINAFLLLLPRGQHVQQYESGVQWLESSFGKAALDYLMTVVTHEPKETCEGAIADLKDLRGFSAERFHICTRGLQDASEVSGLLGKIDVMVSNNDPKHYIRNQRDTQETQETTDSSQLQLKATDQRPSLEDSQKGHETQSSEKINDKAATNANKDRDEITEDNKRKEATMKHKEEKKINNEALLSRLNLQDKFGLRMTPAEFLQIGPFLKHDLEIHEKDIFSVYLHKLLMLDYRARYVQAKEEGTDKKPVTQDQNNEETDDDDCEFFFERKVDTVAQSQQTSIHPLDIQMAVFHCSDSFLKQMIITKLSQCQYALPLLVPDPFTEDIECPLWTLRQIKKNWKKTETKNNSDVVTMKSMPICKAKTPMVFCFRLGSLSVSKSQLINTLINDRHSIFFHRNCPGSTKTRLLFDGVAEITWYCPAGKPSDNFADCVAFCNLRGDALTYDKQLEILMDKSSINVVFVPSLRKDPVISALLKSSKPLIVLIEDIAEGAEKMKKNKYRVGLKDRSQSDVCEELKKIIRDTLSGIDSFFQLESGAKSMATKSTGITVDENIPSCQKGFSAAMEVIKKFGTTEVSRLKKQFLPCQGELWHKWSQKNKELYRLKGDIIGLENERTIKLEELQRLREEQHGTPCSELMKIFIKHLSTLPSIEREYFLKWTQILMDAHATDYLSKILQCYDHTWSQVLELKKKPDKLNELKSKQEELEQISKSLQSATCGLEHIFREMGQIYEAHKSLDKTPKKDRIDWSKYPELAAELMISGHPVELMDGDAGHVPLIWISSLIDQVIHKLGNQRVFVLSVLGIQSSGKSTMLNAMFGLQFAVSAGRCTRGAFMQLVKLSEDIRKDFKWDYILVVDTEGLRALELEGNATIHHDNELATFVVGVGNMTLVNIFGENPSEMQDVLQIVVQAFMRMKKINLSPSCVFVHQNVTDVGAAEKNMDGKRKLLDKLDQMVELAAKEEVCDVESFSDVIEFDVQKDVKYFAQLWEGSPPMAPPNPGYSESVQDLKSFILSKASKSSGVTLTEFKTKVQDLWNALLNENFVFSFRNTLEIAVYRKLEIQYGKWTWSLRQEMLMIEEQLFTQIENGTLDQVNDSYLHGEISKKYNEISKDVFKYFDSDKQKDMLVQWRGSFELKIKDFCDELVRVLQKKLSDVIEQKKAGQRLDEMKPKFENKLLEKSKELAHQLKDKAKDEEKLQKQFNRVWEGWVTELIQGTTPIENITIDAEISKVLQQVGFEPRLIHECRSSGTYKMLSKLGDFSPYLGQKRQKQKHQKQKQQKQNNEQKGDKDKKDTSAMSSIGNFFSEAGKKLVDYFTGHLPQDEQKQIRDHIGTVEKEAIEQIKNKPVATRGYNLSYLYEVASYIITRVGDFEQNWKYSLKKEFTIDLILYVFDKASGWISQSHAQYIQMTDARTYLGRKKSEYYTAFRSFCRGSSSAVVLAAVICKKLKAAMTVAVCNRTAIDIANDMRTNYPGFNESRLNLEKHVLKSLAEKEHFDSYITYIYSPGTYIEDFIQEKVNEYIQKKDNNFIKKNVEVTESFVIQALHHATDKIQEGDVGKWLQEFFSFLKQRLTIDSVSSVNFKDVNKFDFLRDGIKDGLVPIVENMKKVPLKKLKDFRMQPEQMLIDQLCNCCWKTCPFCAAVCTNTVKDHSPDKHCVPFHRPSGIKGWHKTDSVELVIEFCTTLVASEQSFRCYPEPDSDKHLSVPYKKYQTAGGQYAEWLITPSGSKLIYWKWFICRFQKELEDYHNLRFVDRGAIPDDWWEYSKEEAIKSLDEMYNM